MRAMLEQAVQPSATGPRPHHGMAGGQDRHRAQAGERRLRPDKYLSSFVGLAPVSAPRLVVAVMIDEPSAGQHYGGAVLRRCSRRSCRRCACSPCRTTRRWSAMRGRRRGRKSTDSGCGGDFATRRAGRDDRSPLLGQPPLRAGVAFLAYPGEARTAARTSATPSGAARRGGPLEKKDSAGAPNGACPISRSRAEAAGERARARVLRPSLGIALGLRRYRHQWQDFVQPVDRRAARQAAVIGRSAPAFRARSRRRPTRRPMPWRRSSC